MRLLACLIVAPQRGYDEPAILSYAISSFCPTSADGLHCSLRCLYAIIGFFLLEHPLKEILLQHCYHEFTDEFPNPHVPQRRLKCELPDHVMSQRQFSCSLFTLVPHPNGEVRRAHLIHSFHPFLVRRRSLGLLHRPDCKFCSGRSLVSCDSPLSLPPPGQCVAVPLGPGSSRRSKPVPVLNIGRRKLTPNLEQVTCREPRVTPINSAISSRLFPRSTRFLICWILSGVNFVCLPRGSI